MGSPESNSPGDSIEFCWLSTGGGLSGLPQVAVLLGLVSQTCLRKLISEKRAYLEHCQRQKALEI